MSDVNAQEAEQQEAAQKNTENAEDKNKTTLDLEILAKTIEHFNQLNKTVEKTVEVMSNVNKLAQEPDAVQKSTGEEDITSLGDSIHEASYSPNSSSSALGGTVTGLGTVSLDTVADGSQLDEFASLSKQGESSRQPIAWVDPDGEAGETQSGLSLFDQTSEGGDTPLAGLDALTEKGEESTESINLGFENIGETLSNSLQQGMKEFESFGDLANNVLGDLTGSLESSLNGLFGGSGGGGLGSMLSSLLGGGSGGGLASIASSLFGGFFAEGGRPPTNKVSVVGERGPELFVPDGAGTIIPNEALGSMNSGAQTTNSQVVNISVDARGAHDPALVEEAAKRAVLEAAPALVGASESRVMHNLRRPRIA